MLPHDREPLQVVGGSQYATRQALGEHFQAQHAAMLPADGAAMLLGVDGSIREVRPEKVARRSA
ncbi:hypothetical protein [Hymenobacter jeollabukensis]|uniref:Uncharacterized protein n=1 Tax=Hymenobacter jeollabukensis TaxID=2025313 RepID=A0A5R8WJT6_9BACT|nr:hypothetical protein [Hymenobacter jeollabukensis]TLM88950.1 hypothetical protein FDY95_22470 [Hymenobacter jeollabukensis]